MTGRAHDRRHGQDPTPETLGKYRGKWVAVVRGAVVASDDRAIEVLRAMDRDHPDDKPVVYRVPSGEVMLL
jgi:hypothetical protein